MKLGCHVSNKGTEMLVGSVQEAISYGATAFMVYLGAPQNTYRKRIEEQHAEEMQDIAKQHQIELGDVVVHAPYIVNLAQPNPVKRQFAIDFITQEIVMTHAIGSKILVLHPGAHVGEGIERGLELIADSLKQLCFQTKETDVSIAIETMAGKGTECCYQFEQIKTLFDLVGSPRLSVCMDTCHIHDAGYDIIHQKEEVLKHFDEVVGLNRISVLHLNDSKNVVGGKKDRHENLGFGHLGFDTIASFVHDDRFAAIPKILETPYITIGSETFSPYKEEIEMLRKNVFDSSWIEKRKEGR